MQYEKTLSFLLSTVIIGGTLSCLPAVAENNYEIARFAWGTDKEELMNNFFSGFHIVDNQGYLDSWRENNSSENPHEFILFSNKDDSSYSNYFMYMKSLYRYFTFETTAYAPIDDVIEDLKKIETELD